MHDTDSSQAATAIRVALDRDVLKQMAAPAPARLVLQVAAEWVALLAAASLAIHCSHPLVSALSVFLIATRQHALLTLMHEFSHYQFSRRHQSLNDFLGDVFTALPFFITVHGFRRNHLAHHRHTCTELDPNWAAMARRPQYAFPKTKRQFLIEILKHAGGLYSLAELKRYTVDAGMAVDLPAGVRALRAVFFISVLALTAALHAWAELLLYWLLPLSTVLMAILYIRDVGEHAGMARSGILHSRTVLCTWWERFLIGQNNVGYHAEHHLFPSVPHCRLRQLHRHLMNHSQYRSHALITRGYLSALVDEVTTPAPNPQITSHG